MLRELDIVYTRDSETAPFGTVPCVNAKRLQMVPEVITMEEESEADPEGSEGGSSPRSDFRLDPPLGMCTESQKSSFLRYLARETIMQIKESSLSFIPGLFGLSSIWFCPFTLQSHGTVPNGTILSAEAK